MKVGTKSVLFGVHCPLIHSFFVLRAWIKLYGFPWDPRIWVAIFVHDLGYWGKENMDGDDGKTHVNLGANIMFYLFDLPVFFFKTLFGVKVKQEDEMRWFDFCLYHSRYTARLHRVKPSRLCYADKLAIVYEPKWLYLLRAKASGELKEYMANFTDDIGREIGSPDDWFRYTQSYFLLWVLRNQVVK